MSLPKITKENLRAFLDRPWHRFDEANAAHARERHETDSLAAFRLSEELRDWLLAHGSEAGAAEARRVDFQSHMTLRALLDRTSRGGVPSR